MRYFLELSYRGTAYCGWQKQPNSPSVQQSIEEVLSIVLRAPIEIVGCGRTDTGVHASQYFAHLDTNTVCTAAHLRSLNALLPSDIAIKAIHSVPDTAHARFDATRRSYTYFMEAYKNPFAQDTACFYPHARKISIETLQTTADLLMEYGDFFPFCKADNDLENYKVRLDSANWSKDAAADRLVFNISANRFLRGMVRLVVGCCISVAEGKMTLDAVKKSMDAQIPLPRPWSVPAEGLFLSKIEYDGLLLPKNDGWT